MNFMKHFIKETQQICAVADGKVIRLEHIQDQAFSNRMIGDGLALEVKTNDLYAPCKGVVTMIAPTLHAFSITHKNGAELLVHIGLDQQINPDHFHYHVQVNDHVDCNTCMVSLHEDYIQKHGGVLPVLIILLNYQQHPIQTMTTSSSVSRGKKIFTFR